MKEHAHAVLSVLGCDRVGVADDLATHLEQRGLEIEQSRMTALGGQFAVLVGVAGERVSLRALRRDLGDLGATLGFHLQLAPVKAAPRTKSIPRVPVRPSGDDLVIESFSREPSGLNAITGILKRRRVNIETLETEVDSEPCTSRMTFHTTARVRVPRSCPVETLRRELRELEDELPLDVLIRHGEGVLVD